MPLRGEVLVAIMNRLLDFAVARDQHWYRIPVSSADKWLKNGWPPRWLAFYQTKVFGVDAFAVNYYSRVLDVREVYRWQLFPDQPRDAKAMQRYYQLILSPLQRLPRPIISRRLRRIVFIPTTWHRFAGAEEINDLYDESPLEDRLWAELKRLRIGAERQEFVTIKGRNYALDFAVYCVTGKLDLETDGDTWHADPKRIAQDNRRDNDLTTTGWSVLRFNTHQVLESMAGECLPAIVETINELGGVDEGRLVARRASLDPSGPHQLGLFDDRSR
jgi:very-short-patch-repair endonuclease